MSDTEPRPLRAVPVAADSIAPGQPVYADITDPGARRPVRPYWMRSREDFRIATRRAAGREWHRARYHGLRSPWYLLQVLFWGVAGSAWLGLLWLRWWLSPIPLTAQVDAADKGWRDWAALHRIHRTTTKVRAMISGGVLVVTLALAELAWADFRWILLAALAALFGVAASIVRPEGVRIVSPAALPSQYEPITPDTLTVALGSVGISQIDRYLREGNHFGFPHPVRQDGPGWRAEVELPRGVTATMVIERRDRFASGLRRPLGAVWPEPMRDEHPGLLEVWVGERDITKTKQPPYPLATRGRADFFGKIPLGTDPRHRPVSTPLFELNWCIGAAPGQGKTNTVRLLVAAAALDPLPVIWVHELAGKGDLDAGRVADRYVSGLDDEAVAYTAASVRLLRAELEQRAALFGKLPKTAKNEGKLTRELAQRDRRLRPLVCVIDECQNLFLHPVFGGPAADDIAHVMRLGRAYGIVIILSTQRPDSKALPTPIRGVITARFCLQVPDQLANDMILGTGAYSAGYNAVSFRPKTDAGLGWLKATEQQQIVRTHKLDLEPFNRIIERARVLREQAGVVAGYALGEDGDDVAARDVVGDVLAAFGADDRLHWETLAGRLAAQLPDRWAGATPGAVAQQMYDLGLPVRQVKVGGVNRNGCRKAEIEQLGVPA